MATSVPNAPGVQASPQAAPANPAGARVGAAALPKEKAAGGGKPAPETALVATAQAPPPERPRIPPDSPAMRLRVELEVGVPVGEFRVRNLLALEPGTVVESRWDHSEDLPLAAGRVQLAWTEFEVVETQLGARLTRLA